jgi:hypothetical protein
MNPTRRPFRDIRQIPMDKVIPAASALRRLLGIKKIKNERRAAVGASVRHGLDAHARATNPAAESTCVRIQIFAASRREAWQTRANE